MCRFSPKEFRNIEFDLDDTLMKNAFTYNQPFIDFVGYLTEIFDYRVPSIGTIAVYQQDIDLALGKEINPRTGKQYAFCKNRFPDSLADTYRTLCENGFGEYDGAVAEHCREIGMRAFDVENYHKVGLSPGAEDLLNFLQKQGHRLVLVTKGDEWVQNRKIEALNLHRWFSDIYIVEHKTPKAYLDIITSLQARDRRAHRKQCEVASTLVVGNSFSSDIKPALEIGMHAIFIPCPTWKAERTEVGKLTKDEKSRLEVKKNISEIIPWYQAVLV